jgi:hypothetical protein
MAEGFAMIRRGLLDHIRQGKLCMFDLGLYLFLHLACSWSTGIYSGTAMGIAYACDDAKSKKQVQRGLQRLRTEKFINYRFGDGERGRYDILIHKYEPQGGKWLGYRLDAWKHGTKAQPEYVLRAVDGTEDGTEGGIEERRKEVRKSGGSAAEGGTEERR